MGADYHGEAKPGQEGSLKFPIFLPSVPPPNTSPRNARMLEEEEAPASHWERPGFPPCLRAGCFSLSLGLVMRTWTAQYHLTEEIRDTGELEGQPLSKQESLLRDVFLSSFCTGVGAAA